LKWGGERPAGGRIFGVKKKEGTEPRERKKGLVMSFDEKGGKNTTPPPSYSEKKREKEKKKATHKIGIHQRGRGREQDNFITNSASP